MTIKEEHDVRFVAAKSRVAPVKELTIPRLELQTAVLASRLQVSIREECRFHFEETFLFTNSAIVLGGYVVQPEDISHSCLAEWEKSKAIVIRPNGNIFLANKT